MKIGSTKHFDEVTRQLALVDMLTGTYWSQVAALICTRLEFIAA
jgi:hypothetical protein